MPGYTFPQSCQSNQTRYSGKSHEPTSLAVSVLLLMAEQSAGLLSTETPMGWWPGPCIGSEALG